MPETKQKFIFFDQQAANASSNSFAISEKGDKYILISGTFDTATLQVEIENSKGDWIPMDGGLFASPGARILSNIPKSSSIRVTVSSVGAGTLIDAEMTK